MKLRNKIFSFTTLILLVISGVSCTESDKVEITRLPSIMETLNADANYSILRDALVKTGLNTTLSSAGSYTIFTPNNAAFESIGITSASISALTAAADIANLRVILQNHVLGVGTRANDLLAAGYSRTFGFFRANAPLAPTPATPLLTSGSTMSMFVAKVGNDVLINGGVANRGAVVTKADIDVSNGIIHEVNAVILLPRIINHIVSNPELSTLLTIANSTSGAFGDQTAVKNILTGATNLAARTLICPNNTAFTNATTGSGFLTGAAVTPANVTKVLQYHLLTPGNRLRTFFTDGFVVNTSLTPPLQTFTTFTSAPLGLRIQDNGVAPNNVSRFVITDIQAENGVLHIVDKVLQPTL